MKTLTLLIVILFFGCGSNETPPSQKSVGGSEPYEVHCEEPLPIFSLGRNSKPTKEQEKALCECIWKNLDSREREVSLKISQEKEQEVSEINIRNFISSFGSAIKKCGGMEL